MNFRNPAAMMAFAIGILAIPAAAQTVTDGDTIKQNGTIYRLWGIDAPETKQWCGDYPAGTQATATLTRLMKNKAVVCEPRATDRYSRTVALCRANGDDVGREMVRLGMAWAFVRYSRDYVQDEAQARAENLGIHARSCQPAWLWRAERREVRQGY